MGQGGFYTEQFLVKGKKNQPTRILNVIYDCGSTSTKILGREIKRALLKEDIIDILFISHFDNDHINGLKQLAGMKVRYLVLPLLEKSQKITTFLADEFDASKKSEFEEAFQISIGQIIYYRQMVSQDNDQSSNGQESTIYLDEDDPTRDIREVDSGTGLSLAKDIQWVYIPFNVCDNSMFEDFIDVLSKNSSKLYEKIINYIADDDSNELKDLLSAEDIKKLKEIYKEVSSNDRNQTSLVVYSGPKYVDETPDCNFQNYRFIQTTSNNDRFYKRLRYSVGALYTGDLDLKLKIVSPKGIEESALSFIKQKIDKYKSYIGLIQLPHHGSKYNFDPSIIGKFPSASNFFYSYGLRNIYGHPYSGIRLWLNAYHRNLYEITEDPESELKQIIHL